MARRKSPTKVRVALYMPAATRAQLAELSALLNVSMSAIVSQAVARAYRSEPLISRKKKSNGANHPDV